MNAKKREIETARAKAMMSTTLREALKRWFLDKSGNPYPDIKDFKKWIEAELDFLALMLGKDNVSGDNLFHALRVEAIGDPIAQKCSALLERNRILSDSVSYVEDGKVFSSLWIISKNVRLMRDVADKVANQFRGHGYTVDVVLDEEGKETTVQAVIGFQRYAEIMKKEGR